MYNLNCIIVIIFNYTRAYARDYTLIYIYSQNYEKMQLDSNWLLNFAPCVPFKFKFFAKWIIECKNRRDQIQLDSKLDVNWSPIFHHVSIYLFLIFVASKLLDKKTEESKSN